MNRRTDTCDECTARIVEAEAKMTEARTDAISAAHDAEVTKLRNGFLTFAVVYALTLLAGLAGYYLWIGRNVTLWEMTSRERAAQSAIGVLREYYALIDQSGKVSVQLKTSNSVDATKRAAWSSTYATNDNWTNYPSGSTCANQPTHGEVRNGHLVYYDAWGQKLDANNCPVTQ